MSHQSPELIDAKETEVSLELATEATSFSVDEIFAFCAQCDSITDVNLERGTFVEKVEVSTRKHLLSIPSPWRSSTGFWARVRFASFREYVGSKLSPSQKDIALVDYLLRHVQVTDLLSSDAQWRELKSQTMAQFDQFVARMGGAREVERMCEAAFKRQRAILFKDWLVRIVPTLVLVSAVLIAAAMAFRFARSLTFGQ